MKFDPNDLTTILPILTLVAWACALLLVDLFIPKGRKAWTALLAAVGLALSMGLTLAQAGRTSSAFNGMVTLDGFSTFLSVLFLASGLFGVALAYGYLKRLGLERGEFYTLLLFSISGMLLMAQAADLIVTFLALELLSIPLYVLAAFARPRADSEEAGLKYFLLGAFATGFVVYGITLVYGATGSTSLTGILAAAPTGGILLLIGAALILVDARCLPGRSHARDGFHVRRRQGRRVRRTFADFHPGAPLPECGSGTGSMGPVSPDDARRQPDRHLTDQHQAYAGVFEHRPCRVHPDGLCKFRQARSSR
jgi:hypothetical protein